MYYNPITKEQKSHYELSNYLNASIPMDTEEVEQVVTEEEGGSEGAEGIEQTEPIIHTWYLLSEQQYPENLAEDEKAELGDIKLVDGKYIQTYNIIKLSEEEIAEKRKQQEAQVLICAKNARSNAVQSIIVEYDNMKFDGNEIAQERMSRAVLANIDNQDSKIKWVLADNTVAEIYIWQLKKALELATKKQAELWIEPYQNTDTEE